MNGAESIPEAFFRHLVDAFAVREVWRVNKASDSSSALGLSKVESEGAGVGKNVSTYRLGRVTPHGVGLGVYLIGHQNEGVVHVGQLLEVLQVAVEFLLPASEHSAPNEFSTEMAGQ